MQDEWHRFISLNQDTYRHLHQLAIIIAGCSVLIALVLSFLLILEHLRSYTNPDEQKWIIPVLSMVPVYASESFLSLCFPRLALACDILRSCYEAFALYSFGSYLIACLGSERQVEELLEDEQRKMLCKPLLEGADEKRRQPHGSLRNFVLQPSLLGKDLLTIEKFGLVQYMILKTVCAFLEFVLELFGVYGNGEFKWNYGYPYLAVVLNFSQMWALFCLVQFYNVTHRRLEPIKPFAKFVSFKAIVFATWWQGVGIAILCALGVLPEEGKFQTGLQDFLICIEMAIAAVAHVFVFSAKPYQLVPPSQYGKVTTQASEAALKPGETGCKKPTALEETETQVEASGTSVKESVRDIVLEGGQHVVEDVVFTINQAIEPVEKGVTKIQEKFHRVAVDSDREEEQESELKIEGEIGVEDQRRG